jgi:D-xylose transport system substrate-binding protein
MHFNSKRFFSGAVLSFGLIATMVLASCGSSSTTAASGPKGCKKVGVLLPESASSARWESKDHPLLDQQIKAALPGAEVKIDNANGNDDTQLSQAQADLTAGYCILVVAPHDSAKAATIVQQAHQSHVPVIAYDRLINDTSLDFYVSFDGVSVGVNQGQYIAAHYQQYVTTNGNNNIYFIDGADTDNNAHLFGNGAHQVLDPLITAGSLTKVYEISTPNWDNPTAGTEMTQALTAHANKIAVAYVMNDGMAGTVIQALTAQHLNGKVLVTGQDATVAGIQQILLGNQSMTVYKPIVKEAQGTAQLVAALSNGTSTASIATGTGVTYMGTAIPSVLEAVESVDISNVSSTVIADGYVTHADICAGGVVPPGTYGGVTCP